ncbi:MAG: S8 family serine peptidase [Bacteroidales bacterium]
MEFYRRFYFLSIFVFYALMSNSQTAPSKYWIQFTDKENTIYSVLEPEQFLSPRAIEKRIRYNIELSEDDFPVNKTYLDSVASYGAVILNTSKWLNAATIYLEDTSLINTIRDLGFVEDLQKSAKVRANRVPQMDKIKSIVTTKRNSDFTQYNAENNEDCNYDYGMASHQTHMIRADYLHQNSFCGQGMLIGVVDAGFANVNIIPAFDSLWANGQILGYRDFVFPSDNIFENHSHGTMVLSTMAANLPGDFIGTAPKANYLLLRTEDGDTEYVIEEDNWVSAIEFADSAGVDVINSSLGYTTFDDSLVVRTYEDMNGKVSRASICATIAARKGMIICNSAGNSGNKPWRYIGCPADADSILTIGAVNEYEEPAFFTSHGPTYDGRVKPDVSAMGEQTWMVNIDGEVMTGNGTSFSSPIMAGTVACLWQAFPEKTNFEVMDAVRKSADRYNNPDTLLGYGIPNFKTAYEILDNSVKVENYSKTKLQAMVFPNPIDEHFTIAIHSPVKDYAYFQMYDAQGNTVISSPKLSLRAGNNYIEFNEGELLEKGIYLLRILTSKEVVVIKIIK